MATITLDIPLAAPATGVTLVSLADAGTGTTIALPGTVAFAGPVTVGQYAQWSIGFNASSSSRVAWTGTVANGAGPTSPIGGVVDGDLVTPAGYYASVNDLYDVFGQQNVIAWSSLDNTVKTLNVSRVAKALAKADSDIDDFFGGVMATPLPVNNTLTNAAAVVAGAWLYNSRGQFDTIQGPFGDRVVNKYAPMVKDVWGDLLNYKCGIKRFAGATFTASIAPSVAMPIGGNPFRRF